MYKADYNKMADFLVNMGIITINEKYDKNIVDVNNLKRIPTETGVKLGVKIILKESERGKSYSLLMYPESIQKLIVAYFIKSDITT